MKLKKLLSAFLTAATVAASLMSFNVAASAASVVDTAVNVDNGKTVSLKLNSDAYHDYKVTLSKSGSLKLQVNTTAEETCILLYDEDGGQIRPSENLLKSTTGKVKYSIWIGSNIKGVASCYWDKAFEKFKGTVTYANLDKGTYYVRVWKKYNSTKYSGTGKSTIKFTYPQADKSSAKITGLQLTLTKGSEAALSALLSGDGDVTWSSSDKSVATVSKSGKVTAVGKGTAVITAKCGDSSSKITIKVS